MVSDQINVYLLFSIIDSLRIHFPQLHLCSGSDFGFNLLCPEDTPYQPQQHSIIKHCALLFASRYEMSPEMAQLESATVNNISTPRS